MPPHRALPISMTLVCIAAPAWPARVSKRAKQFADLTVAGDKLAVSRDKKTVMAKGDATAKWKTFEIKADQVVMKRFFGSDASPPKRLEAKGNVTLKQKDVKLTGDVLVFEATKATIFISDVRGSGKLGKHKVDFVADKAAYYVLKEQLVAAGNVACRTKIGTLRARRVEIDLRKEHFNIVQPSLELNLK